MRAVEKGQISRIHGILAKIGLANDKDYKKGLVEQYSNMRVSSTTGLLYDEANALINDLQREVNMKSPDAILAYKRRRKLIAMAHEMQWEVEGGKADMKRIDNWCVTYGQFHKALNEHTAGEMSLILVQFEKAYLHHLKST